MLGLDYNTVAVYTYFVCFTNTSCCSTCTLHRHSLRENFPRRKPALHLCIMSNNGYLQLHDIPTNINNEARYTNIFQQGSLGIIRYRGQSVHIGFLHLRIECACLFCVGHPAVFIRHSRQLPSMHLYYV